jgi:ATP-binding cassette subfamily F protein 3
MIRIENLCKAFAKKILFQNATYQFPQGGERVALVGPNGAGKSTLLNILCDMDASDSGKITKPHSLVLGYLPQEPNPDPKPTLLEECIEGAIELRKLSTRLDAAIEQMEKDYSEELHHKYERIETEFRNAGGYALESHAKGILIGLGFRTEQFSQSPKELSGGWRMRLELAKIFLNNPDFLILDEPTNHLDLPSLVWVEKFLQNFKGTVLFVSHDKDLLNRLSTITLHLQNGKLTPYKGNFDSFLEQREQKLALEAAHMAQFQRRKKDLERFVERFKAGTRAKQAQSRMKMLMRMKDVEENFDTNTSVDEIAFSLPVGVQSGREVLRVEHMDIGYSKDKILSHNLNFKILRGQKIAVIGSNGIGKSTLLKTLASRIEPLNGSFTLGHNVTLALHTQDQLDIFDQDLSILENVLNISPQTTERQARQILGSFLFRSEDVFKPFGVLSGGEKSRVGLATLLLQKANFLLLDEPTNHLDMTSSEILANALDEYEGTVLFVSHDRSFIQSICTHVLAMGQDGSHTLYEGQLEDHKIPASLQVASE